MAYRSRRPFYPGGKVIQPDDDARMKSAIVWLARNHIRFTRVSLHQLKINTLNFWPVTGKIYRDGGAKAFPDEGLQALQEILVRSRELRPSNDN